MDMSRSKKFIALLVAILVPLGAAASAQAGGESVVAKTNVKPRAGKFHKKTRVPSKLTVSATVTPGAASATVTPTKRINLKLPPGLSFKPDRRVCNDRKLNPQSSLGDPKGIVAACKRAVVGTGTALIYLAKNKVSPLNDPVLVVFNAGKNRKGQPKLKIYGFSKQTGVGVLMQATLKRRSLSIAIPVLSFDSAVGDFKIQLPGPLLNRPDIGVKTRGKNARYVRASCPRSPLVTRATFVFGERNPSTGKPTGPTTKVNSPATKQKCRAKRR